MCVRGYMQPLIFTSGNIRFDVRLRVKFRRCGLFIVLFLYLFYSPSFFFLHRRFVEISRQHHKYYDPLLFLRLPRHRKFVRLILCSLQNRAISRINFPNFHRRPLPLTQVCCVYVALEFHVCYDEGCLAGRWYRTSGM